MPINRLYRKYEPVSDGLWSGIKKLFGGGKKKSGATYSSEYEEGDRIKFERTNGKKATGIVRNVYWNNTEGAVDYGVQSSVTLDDIVVPEEAIVSDSHKASVLCDYFPNANPNDIADFIADGWNNRLSDSANVRKFKRLTIKK